MNKLHILLLGGGTGGHIYPLVAIASKLRELSAAKQLELDMRYFGDPGTYADYLKQAQIRVSGIASSKFRRYVSALNILDFFKFWIGFWQAMFKLYFFMPEVVFSKSGPGVLPILYAARWYRIPVVIHESDAVPGLTNKISAKHAAVVELAFDHAKQYFTRNKVVNVVGMPVRDSLITAKSPGACRQELGLTDAKPILFIVGGSQGAQRLNEFVLTNAEALLTHFEVVHQVGADNVEQYKKEFEFTTRHYNQELKSNYFMFGYLSDEQMACALAAADVIISRSGSSIFEIAAAGKPAILVPLPSSANNHQFENAYAYAQAGAGVVIEEENLLYGLVSTQIQKILDQKEETEKMRASARAFYRPAAAEAIARDVLAVAGVH
jgi:UDP-N-acetylglucosamine--N-acetylmuramyl-(pentapeptide) pyrophosphoryl-undecaprenol N-acetylglucosamine transferase